MAEALRLLILKMSLRRLPARNVRYSYQDVMASDGRSVEQVQCDSDAGASTNMLRMYGPEKVYCDDGATWEKSSAMKANRTVCSSMGQANVGPPS